MQVLRGLNRALDTTGSGKVMFTEAGEMLSMLHLRQDPAKPNDHSEKATCHSEAENWIDAQEEAEVTVANPNQQYGGTADESAGALPEPAEDDHVLSGADSTTG